MQFKFTTAGESHGKALVAIVEGLPAGLPIDLTKINHELWRRQQGYGRGGRMKIEKDHAVFEGGVRGGVTLGSPIAIGLPRVYPWRTPATNWTRSFSIFIRPPRP